MKTTKLTLAACVAVAAVLGGSFGTANAELVSASVEDLAEARSLHLSIMENMAGMERKKGEGKKGKSPHDNHGGGRPANGGNKKDEVTNIWLEPRPNSKNNNLKKKRGKRDDTEVCIMVNCKKGKKVVGADSSGCGGSCVNDDDQNPPPELSLYALRHKGRTRRIDVDGVPVVGRGDEVSIIVEEAVENKKNEKNARNLDEITNIRVDPAPAMLEMDAENKKKGGKKKDGVSTMPVDRDDNKKNNNKKNDGPSTTPVNRVGKKCKTETGLKVCSACCKDARAHGLNHDKTLKCIFKQDKKSMRGTNKESCVSGRSSSPSS